MFLQFVHKNQIEYHIFQVLIQLIFCNIHGIQPLVKVPHIYLLEIRGT